MSLTDNNVGQQVQQNNFEFNSLRKNDTATAVDEEEVSCTPHPLLLDTVLTQLVPYIRISDLKSSRLVCQKWNYALLPRFKRTFTAEISVKFSSVHTNKTKNEMIMGRLDTLTFCVDFT